jgi:hypothetical protein
MKSEASPATPDPSMTHPPRRRRISLWLSIFGLVFLSYLFGAAVMFFELPTSGFLSKAFIGARAWNERRQVSPQSDDQELSSVPRVTIDKPGKVFNGFTLCACASMNAPSTQAFLMNMRGEVVYKWEVAFSKVWSNPPHIQRPAKDCLACFFGCHLYPNGDLLVVLHGLEKMANGYGLVKLDKNSNVVWKYAANVHHDVDVAEDGTIYAIQHEVVDQMPRGLENIPTPCLVDSLVLLSPKGKRLKQPIPILEAFRDSAYSTLLAPLERGKKHEGRPGRLTAPSFDEAALRKDALHTNFVKVLSRALAPKFPSFKAGQVLISMRNLDTIAVMDMDKASVVWAARGPWLRQHDAQFLDTGHLLIFDNCGLPSRSRVLEYDPQTQAFPWSYAGENHAPFYTSERGMSQRLPNGNTLVVNSEGGKLLEVTRKKELVWSCSLNRFLSTARRYSPDQLQFLKGGQRARP